MATRIRASNEDSLWWKLLFCKSRQVVSLYILYNLVFQIETSSSLE